MWILIVLLFLPVPEQSSKVVISTGVPGAELYLDANFVATTDRNGTLTMEDFPSGSFNLTIKKQGYHTYNGSFTVRDGEAKLLQPVLERIESREEQPPAGPRIRKSPRPESKTPAPVARTENAPPSVAAPSHAVPVREPPPRTSPDEPNDGPVRTSYLPALALLSAAALLAFGIWIRKRKMVTAQIPPLDPGEVENPESPVSSQTRPEPPFIGELKRREELLKAGYVGSRPRVVDQQSMKDKEVVIVLPKEAFRYEDDK